VETIVLKEFFGRYGTFWDAEMVPLAGTNLQSLSVRRYPPSFDVFWVI
jgi:hypothetical protein